LRYDIKRADDELRIGTVIHHIIGDIARADLIIANLEGHNPNVMYELGVAHALSKPTLHMVPATEALRFDISHLRAMTYHLEPADKLNASIQRLVEMAGRNWQEPVENPVVSTLGGDTYAGRGQTIGKLTSSVDQLKLKAHFLEDALALERQSVKVKEDRLDQIEASKSEADFTLRQVSGKIGTLTEEVETLTKENLFVRDQLANAMSVVTGSSSVISAEIAQEVIRCAGPIVAQRLATRGGVEQWAVLNKIAVLAQGMAHGKGRLSDRDVPEIAHYVINSMGVPDR
jgi:hypothetical protein